MSDSNENSSSQDELLLHLAVVEEHSNVVEFLLKHGVPANLRVSNKSLAFESITDVEHRKHVESSLCGEDGKHDLEVDQEKLDAMLAKTTTPLHLAAKNERKDMADMLLSHGADVNATMEGGETPLMIAVLSKRENIVQLLLGRGADVNAKTAWGKTALHYAAQTGLKNIADILIKHGAHVNATTTLEGFTPLHLAAEAGFKDVVVVLMRNEADYEIRAKNGATMLHYAAVMGHKDVLDAAIAHGADINMVIKHGGLDVSPFSWITPAEEKKAWELVSKYVVKIGFVGWYNTLLTKLYSKKEKKGMLISPDKN